MERVLGEGVDVDGVKADDGGDGGEGADAEDEEESNLFARRAVDFAEGGDGEE